MEQAEIMSKQRIIFLNSHQGKSGFVSGRQLPPEYVLTCRFFASGVIDRTSTLDQGFDYVVCDPIPSPAKDSPSFAELCDIIGSEIVAEASKSGRNIHVLWSGGIDSTLALIAIMKAAEASDQRDLVQILLSMDSVQEYGAFYRQYINNKYRVQMISHPISEFLNPKALTVTGEHGDQLFGSMLLEPYVLGGSAHLDYQDVVPLVLTKLFGNPEDAYRVMRYLEPQIAAAPVPIRSLFDWIWWLNYSLKWQQVTLRMAVFRKKEVRETYESLRHFFRDPRLQAWSLANPSVRSAFVWKHYKDVAKQYILQFTADQNYYSNKKKVPSLKNVMLKPEVRRLYRSQVFMWEDFVPNFNMVEREVPKKL